ncbi:hypothetical protein GIB67_018533, partial [Kingdonia uniflora]
VWVMQVKVTYIQVLPQPTLLLTETQQTCELLQIRGIYTHLSKFKRLFMQTLPVVTSVLDGLNVSIFAYGET